MYQNFQLIQEMIFVNFTCFKTFKVICQYFQVANLLLVASKVHVWSRPNNAGTNSKAEIKTADIKLEFSLGKLTAEVKLQTVSGFILRRIQLLK